MRLTGAQILCESLLKEGVEVIFGYPGGQVLPLYDTLPQFPKLRHILVRHEQGAAHAADGYARVTGKVGVCLATSGPGATNLVTGIANANLDSIPVVAITGQVPRASIGKDAFQEVDITGITLPITKYNYLVMEASSIARVVKEAFYIAKTGRPGPVLIDIPRDVFTETAEFEYPEKINLQGYEPTLHGHPAQIKKAARIINEAKKPLIISGHGVLISGAFNELRHLAEKAQIPVVTTLLGIGSFPESHILSFGMLGMHGTVYANKATGDADVIIAIGMRMDDRATCDVQKFAPNAKIVHIDIDPSEIGKNVRVDTPIVGDVKSVLNELNQIVATREHVEWLDVIGNWRRDHPMTDIRETDDLLPQFVIRKIYDVTKGQATIVTGVGQHQMWAAQHYWYDKPNSLISSGGLGTMGFEIPAAIGAKVGRPDDTVWCIAGDGGFQMKEQELGTIMQEHLAVKIAILDNGCLGLPRQWQELLYNKNYVAAFLCGPDFVKLAEAYDIPALRVTRKEDVVPAVRQAMECDGPFIIDFKVFPEENVYPFVPPGKALAECIEDPQKRDRMAANKHTIVTLVEDKPGVLNRVASLLRRRGFNIESIAVGQSELPNFSRMTFVIDGAPVIVEQARKQLAKLIDVVKVSDITDTDIVARELALIKVHSTSQTRSEIIQIVQIFRANIVDVAYDSLTIEITGDEDKVNSLMSLIRPFGIKEITRTGRIAMTRGGASSVQVEEQTYTARKKTQAASSQTITGE